jgi:SAM-dependent methyltransferase
LPCAPHKASLVVVGFYTTHLRPRLLNASLGPGATQQIRERVCTGLQGRVLEIGYGSGLNQPYLPPQVIEVVAVEPSRVALKLAGERQAASPVPVVVVGDDAQRIPVPDAQADTALCTWALCSVPDPLRALHEVRRVLRPGGVLHFVEHGLAPDASVVRWQRRGNKLNKRVAGCVLDRDVPALLAQAGLTVLALETYYDEHSPKPAGYFYEGRAAA